jgi:hypothetical protein
VYLQLEMVNKYSNNREYLDQMDRLLKLQRIQAHKILYKIQILKMFRVVLANYLNHQIKYIMQIKLFLKLHKTITEIYKYKQLIIKTLKDKI